ncbi:MAG: PfkB family carbohydrate kinase [Bacteroidales bacterium]|jgi:fructokinase
MSSTFPTVYCIGETVLDIIFRNDIPVTAKPGGSMLNSAISLGRCGIRVEFVSHISDDLPGEMIIRFLHENQVGTKFINRNSGGKTTIALAFLNENAEAGYSFYPGHPKKMLVSRLPEPVKNDIVLFGSFFSLNEGIRDKLKGLLFVAIRNGAMILYDPNFRRPHLNELSKVIPGILENIAFADIIRGSNEDFLHIFAIPEAVETYSRIRTRDQQVLIYTRSNDNVSIMTCNQTISIPVPKIIPVSTIGAGDSFNAGLIHAFIKHDICKEKVPLLTIDEWNMIAKNAIMFSQNVCMSFDNYISQDFLNSNAR